MTTNDSTAKKPIQVSGVNLDDPAHFNGRHVVERQSSMISTPLTRGREVPSVVSDIVLLDDGAVIHQCRYCGTSFNTPTSVIAHAGRHSPNKRRGRGAISGARAKTSTKRASSDGETSAADAHVSGTDVGEIIRQVRVIRDDARRLCAQSDAVIDALTALDDTCVSRDEVNRLRVENEAMSNELKLFSKIKGMLGQ